MCSHSNIAVLIAAAGGSKRMGQPKQLLPWGQSTLLGHTINNTLQLSPSEVVVVLGAHYHEIADSISGLPVALLFNRDWRNGLGNSIAFGIQYFLDSKSNCDGVLVLLADQPLLDAPYLNSMIKQFKPGQAEIVVTQYEDQKPGVPVLFDRCYFAELALLNSDGGARAVLKAHASQIIRCPATGNRVDIDTKAEYDNLYKANHQF